MTNLEKREYIKGLAEQCIIRGEYEKAKSYYLDALIYARVGTKIYEQLESCIKDMDEMIENNERFNKKI